MVLVLVELACARLLFSAAEGSWRSHARGDGLGSVLCGTAAAALVVVAITAAVAPSAWGSAYAWLAQHCFGGLQR